jgi:hypothetical protein
LEDIDDGGFDVSGAVCAITPEVTRPKTETAKSAGRASDMI